MSQIAEIESGKRVVDHRLVVNRHQLLGDRKRDGMEPRAGTASEDEGFHGVNAETLKAEMLKAEIAKAAQAGSVREVISEQWKRRE
jgi:hypothetical protein